MLASSVFMQSYLKKGKNKTGILDPLNELHLIRLHYTYLPRINKFFEEFVDQMNQRPVSTKHMSPLSSYGRVACCITNSQHTALTVDEMEQYGVDPDESGQ